METIRKAVESLTGDAGVGHTYDTGATTTGTTTAGQRSDVSATGVPSAGLTARRSPDVGATTTTSTTTPSSGREETWQQQRERERVGQYGGGRDELAGRSEETAGAGRTRAEGGVTGLQADEEHRRMMQQQAARQSELEQRTTGKEAGAMGRAGGERGEEKPVTQRIKEGLGMGGAEAQRTEQGRQLGFERGQVPYASQAESEAARRRRDEEQAAISSGRAWEGQRLKSPEYYPTAPYERGYGEEKSYLGGEERGGPSARRGGERRDEGFLAKTFHEIERAVGGIGGGAAAAIGGRAATRSITSTTRYPLCLRTLLKPRPDIRDSKLEGDIIMVQESPTAPTQVIGSIRGINPGLHGMAILENGDLTLLRSSAGMHWDAPGSRSEHGGANTKERHLGDLGNIEVKSDGVAFFNFRVDNLPLIDVCGRSLAIMSGEDDLGQSYCMCSPGACGKSREESGPHTHCGNRCRGAAGNCTSCISQINGNAGHALGLGVIFRTDLVAMERLKNVRLGVGVGEETHREVWGRPVDKRPETYGRGGERESGWEKFKDTMKRSFGSRDEERAAREKWERGQVGGRGYEEPGRYSKAESAREYEEPTYGRERERESAQRGGGGGFLGGLFGSGGKEEPSSWGREQRGGGYGYEKRGVGYDEPKGGVWERERESQRGGGYFERPSESRIRGTDQGVGRDIGGKMREYARPVTSEHSSHVEY